MNPFPISEKVKGKQRAIEPTDVNASTSTSSSSQTQAEPIVESSRNLVIRFTEGLPDLTVTVDKQDYVRDVKRKISDLRPELKDRRLRLIHSGRLLTDGTFLHAWLVSLEERQQRANMDDGSSHNENITIGGGSKGKGTTTWIHCSVGPKLEPGEQESEQSAQLRPVRGFDRLAVAGFSESDIANFRRQFHSQSSTNYLDTDFETEEEYDEHFRALEEQWIDSIDNPGSAVLSQSSSSTHSAVLQGTLMGFFFPMLPFYFMKNVKPAVFWEDGGETESTQNVVFSRRMQMGIVVGFLTNVLFGLWRIMLDTD